MKEVTTYYLEMKSASSLKDIDASKGLQIHECGIKQFQFNKFLYQLVGKDWEWIDNGKIMRRTTISERGLPITKDLPPAITSFSSKTAATSRSSILVWRPGSSARALAATFYLKRLSQPGS